MGSMSVVVCGVISAGWLPRYIVPVLLAGGYHTGTNTEGQLPCYQIQQ